MSRSSRLWRRASPGLVLNYLWPRTAILALVNLIAIRISSSTNTLENGISTSTSFLPDSISATYAEGKPLTMGFARDLSRNDITHDRGGQGHARRQPGLPEPTSSAGSAFTGPGLVSETTTTGCLRHVVVRDTVNQADAPPPLQPRAGYDSGVASEEPTLGQPGVTNLRPAFCMSEQRSRGVVPQLLELLAVRGGGGFHGGAGLSEAVH